MTSNLFFKRFFLSLLILFGALFNGCNEEKSQSLRVALNTWPGYEPVALAKELGYLKENVYLSRVDSATDAIKALKSDIVDVVCLTLDEALVLQDNSDEPIKIFNVMDFSTGGDVIISNKEIKTMKELKGKIIGVESSALGAFMISRAIDPTQGLNLADVTLINVGYEHHEEAFLDSKVDAIVTFEPVKTKLLQGDVNVLFDSNQVKGEIVDVMIAKAKTIKSKKAELQALVDGWYGAVEYVKESKVESLKKMAGYENISYEEFKVAYDGLSVPSLEESKLFFDSKLNNTLTKINNILASKRLIRAHVDLDSIHTDEFLLKKDPYER